jgi:hypothetical protein
MNDESEALLPNRCAANVAEGDAMARKSQSPNHSLLDNAFVNRAAFSVQTFEEAQQEDRNYWKSRTPDERLAALELCRQIAYGYDPTTRGLSRFFEVVEFKPR